LLHQVGSSIITPNSYASLYYSPKISVVCDMSNYHHFLLHLSMHAMRLSTGSTNYQFASPSLSPPSVSILHPTPLLPYSSHSVHYFYSTYECVGFQLQFDRHRHGTERLLAIKLLCSHSDSSAFQSHSHPPRWRTITQHPVLAPAPVV